MAQASARLTPKSKPTVPGTASDAPYVSGEVAAGATSQRTETQVRTGRLSTVLPKTLQGIQPLSYVNAPVKDPGAYALRVTGNCMEPLIYDGDVAVCTPHAELRPGVIVAVHFKDGSLGAIKRLVEIEEMLRVEQLNPPTRLMKPASQVETIHAVAGVIRSGEWIALETRP